MEAVEAAAGTVFTISCVRPGDPGISDRSIEE